MISYYLDPGQGYVFAQNSSWFWAMILAFLGSSLFFLKFMFGFFKKFFWVLLVLLLVSIIGGMMIFNRPNNKNKVIILGIDGMDPAITEKLINDGLLPNLAALRKKGSYSRLDTTFPAESAVAWSSFATGLDASGHGVFDFIMRNPQDYSLFLGLNEVTTIKGKTEIKSRRKGEPFWNILSKNKVPCFIYFCPNTFPPEPIYGKMLSGMGTPDILGNMGKFSFYTTKLLTKDDLNSRGRIVKVEDNAGVVSAGLYGPKVLSAGLETEASIPLKIVLNPSAEKVLINFQRKSFFLAKDAWSDWQEMSFKTGPFSSVSGIAKFYLKSIKPEFELYVTPINFNPNKPPFPVSYPRDFSKEISGKVGYYHTLGMPVESWALSEGRISEKVFLQQVDDVLDERKKILWQELKSYKSGMFFFYFDTLDIIQHMFWRYLDDKDKPMQNDLQYRDTVYNYYEQIDQVVGEVIKVLDDSTTLIVLSDHGFGPFRRSVHLNRWLLEQGYLLLKNEANSNQEFLEGIDWSKTKAYALGFGGIYLNKVGREYYGIVDAAQEGQIKQELLNKLLGMTDPVTGEKIVNNVYSAELIYNGPYIKDSPDLFVGFKPGYRASWQTALGGMSAILVEDNSKKWSGDHLFDPKEVPGVIFINSKIKAKVHRIIDVASAILGLFEIHRPKEL
ncbi:MAG: alkaline phosphatase family protein [Candidatus Omnitrophica bacterium]|nr:alkaline phosphatase family protein [Candidatus Omnitrophota bacterium]